MTEREKLDAIIARHSPIAGFIYAEPAVRTLLRINTNSYIKSPPGGRDFAGHRTLITTTLPTRTHDGDGKTRESAWHAVKKCALARSGKNKRSQGKGDGRETGKFAVMSV